MSELAINRRASFDYDILETYEAGVELAGYEVKSAKEGKINLKGAYALVRNGQLWLLNALISPYQPANMPKDYQPERTRRLLLRKKEINQLIGKVSQKGLTLIPLKVYTKQSKIKVLIGLARHKRKADKREQIKKREAAREIKRTLKQSS